MQRNLHLEQKVARVNEVRKGCNLPHCPPTRSPLFKCPLTLRGAFFTAMAPCNYLKYMTMLNQISKIRKRRRAVRNTPEVVTAAPRSDWDERCILLNLHSMEDWIGNQKEAELNSIILPFHPLQGWLTTRKECQKGERQARICWPLFEQ